MTRTKPDWMYVQSAVIPYRRTDAGLEVLLITSRKGKRWIQPKGVVEPDMTPAASAAQEAFEEAGVRGTVHAQALGNYRYDKWGGTCTVEVFAMAVTEVQEDWPEAGLRRREWLSPTAAKDRLREPALKAMLDGLPGWIAERDGHGRETG